MTLIQAIAAVCGWAILLLGAAALVVALGRRAAARGILAPVMVGIGLRLAVMVVAHLGSLSLGDHGIFFLDDQTYLRGGTRLADIWSAGRTSDPTAYNVLGTYQIGYHVLLGLIFTLGTASIFLGKLVNVLLGGATVYLTGRLGGRLLGKQAELRAAWIAALAPTMVWWSATLMKEALATTLLLLGVLAVTYLPSRRAVIALGFVLAALILTRAPAAAALAVATTVAIVIAGWRAEGRLLSRAVIVFGLAIFGGVLAVVAVVSRGNLTGFFHQYEAVIRNMFHQYQGGNLAHAPYDAVKSLVTPLPWAFDSVARSWDRMLYPGMWLLFCALPLAVVGARRVWRSPEGWAIIVTVATALLIHTITAGFVFRQRSMVEPLILLLALAGATSWRMAARCAAGALTVTAVYAGGQSRSPLLALAIAVVAGLVLLASRRLPSRSFDPPPESTMVAAFRELADPDTAALTSTASRVKREVIHLLVALRSMLASARAAIVRHAPGRSSGPTAGEDAAPEDAPSSPLARAMLAARTELQRAAPKADAHARTAPGRPRPARGRGTALEHLAPPLGSGGSGGRLAAAMDTARSHRAALARLAPGVGSGGSDVGERR